MLDCQTPGCAGHSYHPGRRDVVAGIGLATTAALGGALAGPARAAAANPRRIDVHNHIVPPFYVQLMKDGNMWQKQVEDWSPQHAIEDFDKYGTETAMTTIPNPHKFPTGEAHVKLARACNEYAAKLGSDYKGRFGSFAYLPLPDIDASLKEIEYSLDTLHADGVFLWTSYDDIWVGDPKWNAIWDELNRRKAVIYTHPRAPGCCGNLNIAVGEGAIEWQTDTTRALANTIFSGTAAKYPDMKFIWSHGGGTMPYLVRRFIGAAAQPANKDKVPGGFLAMARKMYYDTAQQLLPPQQWPLKYVVTTPQIVFGTDYPYVDPSLTGPALKQTGIFTDAELAMIDRGNAEKLFPRFRT